MTEKSKTQQKLVDSIRKTKAGAAAKTTAARPKTSRAKAAPAVKTETKSPVTADSYQSSGRVWPD